MDDKPMTSLLTHSQYPFNDEPHATNFGLPMRSPQFILDELGRALSPGDFRLGVAGRLALRLWSMEFYRSGLVSARVAKTKHIGFDYPSPFAATVVVGPRSGCNLGWTR